MLTVEVKLNGRVIATASARNISGLAEVSDYYCTWVEEGSPETGEEGDYGKFQIDGHRRCQSVWALVAKIVVAILGAKTGQPEGNG
jgi:hypothetical protein